MRKSQSLLDLAPAEQADPSLGPKHIFADLIFLLLDPSVKALIPQCSERGFMTLL